jgi:hypothetical protein
MKFSKEVKNIISTSKRIARQLNNSYLTPEHLFLGLIHCDSKITIDILNELGVETINLSKALKDEIQQNSKKQKWIDLSLKVKQILKDSAIEAKIFKSKNIESYHLLAAILLDKENELTKRLNKSRIDYKEFTSHIKYRIHSKGIEIVIPKSPLRLKEVLLLGRIRIMRYFSKNRIVTDRKIVKLMVYKIRVKGGASETFQDKLFQFLDKIRYQKEEEEFKYLVGILTNK